MLNINWVDSNEYAYLNELTLSGWAWEFLRRNPEYQKDYDNYSSGALTDEAGNKPVQLAEFHGKPQGPLFFIYPPLEENQTPVQWLKKYDDNGGTKVTINQFFKEKWGLKNLPRDYHRSGADYIISRPFHRPQVRRITDHEDIQPTDENVIIEFSMNADISEQVKIVEKFLHEKQGQLEIKPPPTNDIPKPHKQTTWEASLRVWDARNSSPQASFGEIAKKIHNNKEYKSAPQSAENQAKTMIIKRAYLNIGATFEPYKKNN